MAGVLPRYPVYVLLKGRYDLCLTAQFLVKDGVPFTLVVEPQEADLYAREFGRDRLFVLPFRDRGSVVPARNAAKDHAAAAGHARHWQLDDNIRAFRTWLGSKRMRCPSGPAFAEVEDFVDRWENVAIAGIRHLAYADRARSYSVNKQVYCCVLVDNRLPFHWRGTRGEDTDYSLQVLSAGYCTVLVNAFFIDKAVTGTCRGGNTEATYTGDGRLKAVRELQRAWPSLISITRRHGVPRMNLGHVWRKFDTPLRPKVTP